MIIVIIIVLAHLSTTMRIFMENTIIIDLINIMVHIKIILQESISYPPHSLLENTKNWNEINPNFIVFIKYSFLPFFHQFETNCFNQSYYFNYDNQNYASKYYLLHVYCLIPSLNIVAIYQKFFIIVLNQQIDSKSLAHLLIFYRYLLLLDNHCLNLHS